MGWLNSLATESLQHCFFQALGTFFPIFGFSSSAFSEVFLLSPSQVCLRRPCSDTFALVYVSVCRLLYFINFTSSAVLIRAHHPSTAGCNVRQLIEDRNKGYCLARASRSATGFEFSRRSLLYSNLICFFVKHTDLFCLFALHCFELFLLGLQRLAIFLKR